MDKSSKENLVNDIENRLDDFFEGSEGTNTSEMQTISLEKLKSVVLSIDWEITEKCLTDLIDETNALLPLYQKDRISHALLRMLKAVGRYIRKRKAQAHPDAIKRVMSVFSSLEQLTGNEQIEEQLKKRIVAKEIAAFKKLKQQVELQKGISPGDRGTEPVESQAYVERERFEQAMSAVEKRLNSQVEDLKSQLATLQKELDSMRST
ncbi:MAG: hypothetical protein PVH87_17690 [Desulfobacteraceae bacterium]